MQQDIKVLIEQLKAKEFYIEDDDEFTFLSKSESQSILFLLLQQAKPQQSGYTTDDLYTCALAFFYYWYNAKGNNTAQGLQDWIKTWVVENPPPQQVEQLEDRISDEQLADEDFAARAAEAYITKIGETLPIELVMLLQDTFYHLVLTACHYKDQQLQQREELTKMNTLHS